MTYPAGTLALGRAIPRQYLAKSGNPARLSPIPPHGRVVGMTNEKSSKASASLPPRHFSDETLESLRELGEVIREIHDRLISEGYVIEGGEIYKPGSDSQNDAG